MTAKLPSTASFVFFVFAILVSLTQRADEIDLFRADRRRLWPYGRRSVILIGGRVKPVTLTAGAVLILCCILLSACEIIGERAWVEYSKNLPDGPGVARG